MSQKLEAHTGDEEPLEGVRVGVQPGSQIDSRLRAVRKGVEHPQGNGREHGLGAAEGFEQIENRGGIGRHDGSSIRISNFGFRIWDLPSERGSECLLVGLKLLCTSARLVSRATQN